MDCSNLSVVHLGCCSSGVLFIWGVIHLGCSSVMNSSGVLLVEVTSYSQLKCIMYTYLTVAWIYVGTVSILYKISLNRFRECDFAHKDRTLESSMLTRYTWHCLILVSVQRSEESPPYVFLN